MKIRIKVNGMLREDDVEPRLLLVHYLREVAGLTGTHIGCETSSCGACTVLLDGESVKSCTVFAVQADGGEVTTIEGLAPQGGAPSAAAGFLGRAWAPVWLLHAGHDYVGAPVAVPQSASDAG